jgi:hypothetical protein
MTRRLRKLLVKVKNSNDISNWMLTLLTLSKKELIDVVGKNDDSPEREDVPIALLIVAKFLLDKKDGGRKVKIIFDFIKENKEKDLADAIVSKLKIELINSDKITENNKLKGGQPCQ